MLAECSNRASWAPSDAKSLSTRKHPDLSRSSRHTHYRKWAISGDFQHDKKNGPRERVSLGKYVHEVYCNRNANTERRDTHTKHLPRRLPGRWASPRPSCCRELPHLSRSSPPPPPSACLWLSTPNPAVHTSHMTRTKQQSDYSLRISLAAAEKGLETMTLWQSSANGAYKRLAARPTYLELEHRVGSLCASLQGCEDNRSPHINQTCCMLFTSW